MGTAKVTGVLLFTVTASVLGMFQFGYNTGVINSPSKHIVNFTQSAYETNESTAEFLFSLAVSIFAIGGMIGCPLGSWIAEKLGRKIGLILNAVLGVVAAALLGFCKLGDSYEMFVIGRFIIGINCGFATTISPTYVSEISPLRYRGAFGTVNQLAVAFGLVLSQLLGIDSILGTVDGWPILLGLAVVPSALQILLLPFAPESPRYLLIKQRDEERARNALVKIRNVTNVDDEINEMQAEDRAERQHEKFSILTLISSPALRAPLIIGIVMHLSQQWGGINAVLYYSTTIFKNAGLEEPNAKLATIGVGSVLAVMALVSIPLMDSLGRRTLQLTGLALMCIFSILMTVAFFTYVNNSTMSIFAIIFTLAYVASFGVGPSSIPWMIMSELFGQESRSAAVSIGALVNWFANFIIGLIFLPMNSALGNYVFLPFTVLLIFFYVFTYFKLPETKNRTIEEVTALFRK